MIDLQPVLSPHPQGIPEDAFFMGAGVCEDAQDQFVACGLFVQSAARQTMVYHCMVFYDKPGQRPLTVNKYPLDNRENAFTAELAYQIGLRLLDNACCEEGALQFLKHAHTLFPNSAEYRETYYWYKLESDTLERRPPCPKTDEKREKNAKRVGDK